MPNHPCLYITGLYLFSCVWQEWQSTKTGLWSMCKSLGPSIEATKLEMVSCKRSFLVVQQASSLCQVSFFCSQKKSAEWHSRQGTGNHLVVPLLGRISVLKLATLGWSVFTNHYSNICCPACTTEGVVDSKLPQSITTARCRGLAITRGR